MSQTYSCARNSLTTTVWHVVTEGAQLAVFTTEPAALAAQRMYERHGQPARVEKHTTTVETVA